jgi:hypothetical protein
LIDTPNKNDKDGKDDKQDKEGIDSSTIINDFESTVHLTLTQATDMRVMSDEEMDAQIAEINQALKKFESRQ